MTDLQAYNVLDTLKTIRNILRDMQKTPITHVWHLILEQAIQKADKVIDVAEGGPIIKKRRFITKPRGELS